VAAKVGGRAGKEKSLQKSTAAADLVKNCLGRLLTSVKAILTDKACDHRWLNGCHSAVWVARLHPFFR
jgi:hypothetical protein